MLCGDPSTVVDPARVSGSFRDPSGYVFQVDQRVFRAIDNECYQTLWRLKESGVLAKLEEDKLLVGTQFVEKSRVEDCLEPGYSHVLEHELIPVISYPYEWCVSMLADAGRLTLDLQRRLLESECALKDATAFNVQFVDGRPVFIDISSIERPKRLDIWVALGQFNQMFTFPLLLKSHHAWDLCSYFLAHLNGRRIEDIVPALGYVRRWRPAFLLDITLPYLLRQRKPSGNNRWQEYLSEPNSNPKPQLYNLTRLHAKISRLASSYKPRGLWAGYTETCTYDDVAENAKKDLVRQFLETINPATVLDLGCNTGDYSYLAAEAGARVISVDSDHDAIELLYRRLKRDPKPILPLVVDVANPTPAIGFRNRERESFLQRANCECTLALALVHHLLVSAHLTPHSLCEFFCDLTDDYLIVEYIPPEDSMYQQLLTYRAGHVATVSRETFLEAFGQRFDVLREESIPNSSRLLMLMRRSR